MSAQPRRRRLFPRALGEVMKAATSPLVKQQSKFYAALMRDWAEIVGAERAAYLRPQRVQFGGPERQEAVLHLDVSAARAPEVVYMETQILEQLARYFGYKAVTRLVLHSSHEFGQDRSAAPATAPVVTAITMPDNVPRELKSVLTRMAQYVIAKDDKRD